MNFGRRRVEQQAFGEASFFYRNRREALQFLRVHDRQVEPGFGRVVKEYRVNDFAGLGGQTEADIRYPQNGLDERDFFFDQTDRLDGLHRAADVVFVARGTGEDQRADDDVLGLDAV